MWWATPASMGYRSRWAAPRSALLELTRGFSVFANERQTVDTEFILCVLNSDNQIVYQFENSCPSGTPTPLSDFLAFRLTTRVLDPRIAM